MKFQFSITQQEYTDFFSFSFQRSNKLNQKQQVIPKKPFNLGKSVVWWVVFAIVFVTIEDVFDIEWSLPLSWFDSFHWPSALLAALVSSFFLILIGSLMKGLRLNFINFKEDSPLLCERTVDVSCEGIEEKSLYASMRLKWAAIEAVNSNNGAVYLYIEPFYGYIIPKSAFKSFTEREALIAFVNQQLQLKKLNNPSSG